MVDPRSTQVLVEQAKAGDRSAFDALVGRYRDRLRSRVASWARYRMNLRLDVEDVIQDAFLRVLEAIERLEWRDEEAFFGWLCGVAKNALADSARGAAKEALRKASGIRGSAIADPGPTQSQTVRREERFARLEAALEELSPDHRQALILARIEGLTMKEIAARMDRTPNAVKHLIARGLRELRKRFGNTGSLHLPDRRIEAEVKRDGE